MHLVCNSSEVILGLFVDLKPPHNIYNTKYLPLKLHKIYQWRILPQKYIKIYSEQHFRTLPISTRLLPGADVRDKNCMTAATHR